MTVRLLSFSFSTICLLLYSFSTIRLCYRAHFDDMSAIFLVSTICLLRFFFNHLDDKPASFSLLLTMCCYFPPFDDISAILLVSTRYVCYFPHLLTMHLLLSHFDDIMSVIFIVFDHISSSFLTFNDMRVILIISMICLLFSSF